MVKLPVTVYNHHKKEEVISSALHLQRQLELLAEKEEASTGKYIRPIVLFQAQSNIKGKNNETFDKIKKKLLDLDIPEEQIKIKVSGRDELKGINLNDKDCPVRYIITVNALKEGWDCPNAYILASLAHKSSAVDVEQILGRILRLPYTSKHNMKLLNLSYVLTASSKFQETLDNIIKGLQESGFSRNDYYAEELPPAEEPEPQTSNTSDEATETTLTTTEDVLTSDDDFDTAQINFDPKAKPSVDDIQSQNPFVQQITQQAEAQSEAFDQKIKEEEQTNDKTATITNAMGQKNDKYRINQQFQEIANSIRLAQFFRKNSADLTPISFIPELNEEHTLLDRQSLMRDFNLAKYDANLNFNDADQDIYQVDFDQQGKRAQASKLTKQTRQTLVKHILSQTSDQQKNTLSKMIVSRLKRTEAINDKDLIKYVQRILDLLNPEQISDLANNEYQYVNLIQKKVDSLKKAHVKEQFFKAIDANEIVVKENYSFPAKITLQKTSTPIVKSLYEREAPTNKFEQEVIFDIAALSNVVFWHRNLERGNGFHLNGYYENHYPDFIIYTTKGTIIILETKGDHLNNNDSKEKNELGKKWAEKQGEKFKYFMVFQTEKVPNTYTHSEIVGIIEKL
jgi:type III restriction enzyme